MRKVILEPKGKLYGEWEVLQFHLVDSHNDARWFCKCRLCGEIYSVRGFALRNGSTHCCIQCARKRRQRHVV